MTRPAPREVILLLEQFEQVARQIGRSEAMQETLVTRVGALEARLAAMRGVQPIPTLMPERLPEQRPPSIIVPTQLPLARLLDQMERLGREIGRAETSPPDDAATVVPEQHAPAAAEDSQGAGVSRGTERTGPDDATTALARPPTAAPEGRHAAFRPIRPVPSAPPVAPQRGARAKIDIRDRRWLIAAVLLVVLVVLALAVTALLTASGDERPEATATAAAVATVPTPAATLEPLNGSATRVPGIYSFIATPTPAPTAQPALGGTASPTLTAAPASTPIALDPGVGSARATLEAQFGRPQLTRTDGVSVYIVGQIAISVLYSDDDLALRIVLDFTLADPPLTPADAGTLLAGYRPRDAVQLRAGSPTSGAEQRVYRSGLLANLFAGRDAAGRDADRYLEEVRVDPATGSVIMVTMAVGDE